MSDLRRIGDLEIDQDLRQQRLEWRIERIGWFLMAVILCAAALGLFGSGVLSRTIAGEEYSPFWIRYERFMRRQSPQQIEVHSDGSQAQGSQIRISLEKSWLERVEISRVDPPPERVESDRERLIYVFNLSTPGAPITVVYRFQPDAIGKASTRVGIAGGPELQLNQIIYP